MIAIVPPAVEKLLSEWHTPAAAVPSTLPEMTCPGDVCPRCGSRLGYQNQYVVGRGYLPYEVCSRFECDYQRRAKG